MAKAKKHISWIDLLRIWAAFWVIVSHVQSSFYWNDGIETKGGIEQLVLAGFSRFAVPVFIMISGTLFLHCNEVCSLKENGKRIFRLLVILLFWNCFYAFFTEFHSKDWQFDRFIKNLTCGNYHLWYLYMLIGVYVTIPILQYISKNKTLLVYLTVLSCIFTSIIPTLRKVQFFSNSEIFNTVIDTINFKFALGGVMYFLLGYLVDDFITTSKKRNILIIIGIISLILSFILGYYECLYSGNKNFIWYDYYAVNIMLYSIGMFAFFKRDYKFSEKKRTCFAKIANLSFGIYLVHDFFKILVNEKYSTLALNIPKLAGVFIVTGIVFLLSLLASWGLKKIPKLNRYIL